MKKYIIILAVLSTLASCTKNASLEVAPGSDDSAIGFSAYSGTAATKGTVAETKDIISTATTGGIGVFAFYQSATNKTPNKFNSRTFATPDFMYDIQVRPSSVELHTLDTYNAEFDPDLSEVQFKALPYSKRIKEIGDWTYSPIQFWPNNEGDLISVFAYTPYDENKTWEDLGFKTDVNATKLSASFPIYTEKKMMEDYVFATPALNKSKQNIGGAKINFDFKHITSRVAIQVGAIVDATATSPKAFPQPDAAGTGTVITVESIGFQGIAEGIDYTYYIEADGTDHPAGSEAFVSSGSQNLLLTAKAGDFQNNTSASWTDAKWKTLLADEDDKPGYLFIAPQDLTNAKVVITYKVATTDKSNPANNSTIKNVIPKTIGVDFESGKAYVLNLLIGMNTVEISATVTGWDETADATQIDVPANEYGHYYEDGTDYGVGIKIENTWWAPVNCGIGANYAYPYGKLYQWGRKYGQGCENSEYSDIDISDIDYPGKEEGHQSLKKITSRWSSHPDGDSYNGKFYYGSGLDNWYGGKSPAADNLWKEDGSSKYNPCPDGWRVPTKDEFESLMYEYYDLYGTIHKKYRGSWYEDKDEDKYKKGWDFGSGLFFPAFGSRNGSDGVRTGTGNDGHYYGFYWSSSVWNEMYEDICSYALIFDESNLQLGANVRSNGYSVRCVQE